MYRLWNACQYIKHHFKVYVLFSIQLIFITCIVIMSLGLLESTEELIREKEEMKQIDIVYPVGKNVEGKTLNHYSLAELDEIKNVVPEVNVALAKTTIVGLLNNVNEVVNFNYYEVSDQFPEIALSEFVDIDLENTIYLPQNFLDLIDETLVKNPNYLQFLGFDIHLIDTDKRKLELNSGTQLNIVTWEDLNINPEIKILFNSSVTLETIEDYYHSLSQSILVSYKYNVYQFPEILISLGFLSNELDMIKLNQISSILQTYYPQYQFKFFSLKQLLYEKRQEIHMIIKNILTVVTICTVIVIIGLCGLLSILLERRKKQIALKLVTGASRLILLQEIFLEILIVVSGSCLIGAISSSLFSLFKLKIFDVEVIYTIWNVISIMFFTIMITAWITLFLGKKYLNIEPIKVLSEE